MPIRMKMSGDYTVEFVWIMSLYNGCSRDTIEELLRTPAIRRHTAEHRPRFDELLQEFPATIEPGSPGRKAGDSDISEKEGDRCV